MDMERNLEAAQEFAKAAELKPDDYESIFNAGVAYRQAGRNQEAELFYRKAVQLKPKDPSTRAELWKKRSLGGVPSRQTVLLSGTSTCTGFSL